MAWLRMRNSDYNAGTLYLFLFKPDADKTVETPIKRYCNTLARNLP